MPELDAFLGREDQRALASLLLAEGAVLVSDKNYETSHHQRLRSVDEFERARLDGVSLFYILSDAFDKSPLEMRFLKEKGNYFIMPRNGGPAIEYSCGAVFFKDGIQHIAQSFLAHYSTYWNTLSNKNEKSPEELKLFYSKVARHVKAVSTKIRTKNRIYWIGTEAERLRRKGAKFVGVDA